MDDEPGRALQVAELDLSAGPVKVRARVQLTPAGLIAIAGLVSSILVSTSLLVWVATAVPRRHPLITRIRSH